VDTRNTCNPKTARMKHPVTLRMKTVCNIAHSV
jgi:hypothetical protein